MTSPEKPCTAQASGLMVGFPPLPDKRVTHANQLFAPYNRWSFQNELKLNRTAEVWRGNGGVTDFEYAPFEIGQVTYKNRAGQQFTFEEMVELSYTDGMVVLHQGKIIYERYLNGMKPYTLHAWASGIKSMTGTLAALLVHEGHLNPTALVASYLPELQDSGFGNATLQQVLDMTTAVKFPDVAADPVSESWQYSYAAGWRVPPLGYQGAQTIYDFLPLMQKEGEHGNCFAYNTTNTDVLVWIIQRVLHQTLSEVMQERIWSKLGAERDAFWIVDAATTATAGSGLISTLRDMVRFGQMLLQQGYFNGQQILPTAVVAEIEKGADPAAFGRGPAAGPSNQGYSYHQQWWITHNEQDVYQALGYGGQMLYIDPGAQMVVAKFSSYPTPTPAGNEFYSAFGALPALGKILAH